MAPVTLHIRFSFGTIHADIKDPYMAGWIKTLTARNGFDPREQKLNAEHWCAQISGRRERGLIELPLVADDEWRSSSTEPVSSGQLDTLYAKMRQYFEADPDVRVWELGIEENLGLRSHRQEWPYFWSNLATKARTVRRAADAVNSDIKLVYQIAELDYESIEAFTRSKAAPFFDILSLHPYIWPDFPSPEEWLPEYLERVREFMTEGNAEKPIWFTEVGSPHHGHPDGFFGYSQKLSYVEGHSRSQAAVYLVKTHVMSLHLGVEKVFWYNYRDRGNQRDYPEDHFGMRDYWGYPKPAYAAHSVLRRELTGKKPVVSKQLPNGLHVYEFRGREESCLIAWVYPQAERNVNFGTLKKGLTAKQIIGVVDMVGAPLPYKDDIRVNGDPILVIVGESSE